jgi:hypothetical protein
MYSDGPLFRPHSGHLGETIASLSAHLPLGLRQPRLLLARRQALARLRPLDQRGLRVADGSADLDVGRAVAAHARLGQPGEADLKKLGRFFRGKQHDDRRGGLLRPDAAGDRRLRCHFLTLGGDGRHEAHRPGPPGHHSPK